MSESTELNQIQQIVAQVNAQATAEVLKTFVPQLFSSPKIIRGKKSKDQGDQDVWMMSNFPPSVLIPLAGLQTIAEADDRTEIKEFIDVVLRGFKGIGGFASKQGETIAIGMAGGGGRKKIIKKPGVIGRYITNRSWERKAREQGAAIAE